MTTTDIVARLREWADKDEIVGVRSTRRTVDLRTAADCIEALEAEVAKLRTPEWFYNADDGEYTYGDVSDTVDDMGHEGVMRVGGAREVWKKWAAVRCVALDDAGDVDETEVMTFDTEDEALRCLPESFAKARAALGGGE